MAANKSTVAPKRGLPAIHPGAILREDVMPALKAAGHSKVAVAEALGVSRQTLDEILKGQMAISPEMALRIGKLCGNGPDVWLGLQREWDLERARERLGDALEAIPTWEAAA